MTPANSNALSYVCGASNRPLLYKTVGQALNEAAEQWPDNDAIIVCHQKIRKTYKELLETVNRFAAGLISLGLERGDRVGVWSPNNFEWVIAQLATAKAGLIQVNINPAYRLRELEHVLKTVECKALIMADRFKTSDYLSMIAELVPDVHTAQSKCMSSKSLPDLETVIVIADNAPIGCHTFQEISEQGMPIHYDALKALHVQLQPDDPINIQFTSGTTGTPKGATLSHFNILNNGYFVADRQNFTSEDRLCIPVPLYHCFGMVMGVLGCLSHGACMVFPDEAFDPLTVLRAVSEEKCTALYGVPTMFIAELDHPQFNEFDLTSLRTGVMAGSSCPVEIMRRVISDMNMSEVTICYGMTETSPVSTQSMTDDPIEKRVSTVGRIHPYVEVKIIDEEDRVVPCGIQGELLTRGYSVMQGYWGDKARSSKVIDKAGWMHTGDLACMDEDGFVCITGRLKDMIIRGGENIYPREIEEFLFTHPMVKEAQIFGVTDDKFGEVVCAWIQPKGSHSLSESDVQSFCKGQIAHYKIPKHIRFVEGFPMTVTGKIQKFEMRRQMESDLNQRSSA